MFLYICTCVHINTHVHIYTHILKMRKLKLNMVNVMVTSSGMPAIK